MIVARSRKAISEVTSARSNFAGGGLATRRSSAALLRVRIRAPPVANNDSYQTSDIAVLTGNLFDNDTPGDVPFEVTAVNGSALAVGREIILASGARLRVNFGRQLRLQSQWGVQQHPNHRRQFQLYDRRRRRRDGHGHRLRSLGYAISAPTIPKR